MTTTVLVIFNILIGIGRGGGQGIQESFTWGGFAPRSNPLPFYNYTIFGKKGTAFLYLLLTNGPPAVNALTVNQE